MIYFGVLKLRILTTWHSYIIHILICLTVGIIFCYVELKVTSIVKLLKNKRLLG